MTSRVYLDYNASAPLKPAVKTAVAAALDLIGNPSSVHGHGRTVRRALDEARGAVAALARVAPTRVVFTSGGTEANNLALRGFPGRRVLVSAVEHDSVLGAAPDAGRLPVDADGVVDLEALERRLSDGGPALVSLQLVNNETGVIQPVAEAARIAHAHGAVLHCDAVQAAGRLPIGTVDLGMADLGADLLSLSAHKIGGPAGAGALLVGDGLDPRPLLLGGGQERRRRAGTENLLGLVGFGAAAVLAAEDLVRAAEFATLRDSLEERVLECVPGVRVMGAGAARVGNVSCLTLPGVPGETQVMALDLAGISVSAGAACSSGKVKASHVLAAMGADAATAGSAVRVSLGWGSTAADVERFVAAYAGMAARLSGGSAA